MTEKDREPLASREAGALGVEGRGKETRSDLILIRRSSGSYEWITPAEFRFISQRKLETYREVLRLRRQRNVSLVVAAVACLLLVAGSLLWLQDRGRPRGRGALAPDDRGQVARASGGRTPERETPDGGMPVRGTPDRGMPDRGTSAPAGEAGPEAPAAAPAPEAPEEPAAVAERSPPSAGSPKQEIEEAVLAWARAWSRQDVDEYLSFYSARFDPPDDLDRADWETQRRQRIRAPERLSVTVSDLEASAMGPTSALARFVQSYESPGFRDRIVKVLLLAREADRWRILEERSTPFEAGP